MLQSLANGRLILVLEGGYNLIVTAEGMTSCVSVMLGDACQSVAVASAPCQSSALSAALRLLSELVSVLLSVLFSVQLSVLL
ncbi:hypothetical protein LSAT2_032362 [Lamellibrachia satsuma]|nr:hypothetical protein LSAT2_032362 [Lamellibrachia satsuma]